MGVLSDVANAGWGEGAPQCHCFSIGMRAGTDGELDRTASKGKGMTTARTGADASPARATRLKAGEKREIQVRWCYALVKLLLDPAIASPITQFHPAEVGWGQHDDLETLRRFSEEIRRSVMYIKFGRDVRQGPQEIWFVRLFSDGPHVERPYHPYVTNDRDPFQLLFAQWRFRVDGERGLKRFTAPNAEKAAPGVRRAWRRWREVAEGLDPAELPKASRRRRKPAE